MPNMSHVLNLTKIPGVKYVQKIPDIETIHTKSNGTLYSVKYMVDSGDGKKLIRIESKDKSFKSVFSISTYDNKLQPSLQMVLKDNNPKDFLDILSKSIIHTKVKKGLKENFISESYVGKVLNELSPETMMHLANAAQITMIAMYGMMVGSLLYLYYKIFHNWYTEHVIVPREEQKMNDELFQGQTKEDSAFMQYKSTVDHIDLLTHGNAKAVILCGPPGMSKTYIVKRTLFLEGFIPQKEYVIEKGATMGIADVYSFLYKNRSKIVVFDDFDTPLKNPDIVNMIKSITDTYGKRILSMPREKMIQGGQQQETFDAPGKFEFDGKIIIITNLHKKDIDSALLSRAPAHEIYFNTKQVMESVEKMIVYISPSISIEIKQEVLDYLSELYKKNPKIKIDFRTVVSAIDARVGNPEGWKNMVKFMVSQ